MTGVAFAEMTEVQANKLRADQPHLVVVRDQPISLIDPVSGSAFVKKTVADKDLWHLRDEIRRGIVVTRPRSRYLEIDAESFARIASKNPSITFRRVSVRQRKALPSPFPRLPAQSELPRRLWHRDAIGLTAARRNGLIGEGEGITVALLDSGIDAEHPEFEPGNIFVQPFDGHQLARRRSPRPDKLEHGTYVAGLIAGKKIGIAPKSRLLCAQVLSPSGSCSDAELIAGLKWITLQIDVKVAVIALGMVALGPASAIWQSVIDQLLECDILPVIAAGNEGVGKFTCPANTRGCLSVGASALDRKVASFSSSGKVRTKTRPWLSIPSLVAPGKDIYSTAPGGRYNKWTGATPATAIAAGVAALVRERYPEMTAAEVRDCLIDHCHPLKVPKGRQGAGLLRVEAACR